MRKDHGDGVTDHIETIRELIEMELSRASPERRGRKAVASLRLGDGAT
jgi:hypothetical protein